MAERSTELLLRTLFRDAAQRGDESSYVGGRPKLPPSIELPQCTLCRAPLTFFFQHAFTDGMFAGKSLAFFFGTACFHKGWTIPEMLSFHDAGYDIPEGFLKAYQRNFRVFVFNTEDGAMRDDYQPRLKFGHLVPTKSRGAWFLKAGGAPKWRLDDESPSTYAGKQPIVFLMQTRGIEFPALPGVIGQDDGFGNLYTDAFWYFNGNEAYFFSTHTADGDGVYILTQK